MLFPNIEELAKAAATRSANGMYYEQNKEDKKFDIENYDQLIIDDYLTSKFEKFIDNINTTLENSETLYRDRMIVSLINREIKTTPMDFIFDRTKLNELGHIIMKNAIVGISTGSSILTPFTELHENPEAMHKEVNKFIYHNTILKSNFCEDNYKRADCYLFIFWSLMILTVDDTMADYKLSRICEFAKILDISGDELIEIATLIKVLYEEKEKDYHFKSPNIERLFKDSTIIE